eukprot:scaffold8888_cov161-Amphora_coffeaeformis.AAC.6
MRDEETRSIRTIRKQRRSEKKGLKLLMTFRKNYDTCSSYLMETSCRFDPRGCTNRTGLKPLGSTGVGRIYCNSAAETNRKLDERNDVSEDRKTAANTERFSTNTILHDDCLPEY